MKAPSRQYELTISIGADSRELMLEELEFVTRKIHDKEIVENDEAVSMGERESHYVKLQYDSTMTNEKFHKDFKAFGDAMDAELDVH